MLKCIYFHHLIFPSDSCHTDQLAIGHQIPEQLFYFLNFLLAGFCNVYAYCEASHCLTWLGVTLGNFNFVALYNFTALENDALFSGFRYVFSKNVSNFITIKYQPNEHT